MNKICAPFVNVCLFLSAPHQRKIIPLKLILFLTILIGSASIATAQCTFNNKPENGSTLTPTCSDQTVCMGSGAYLPVNVIYGVKYDFFTCNNLCSASAWDTQISGFELGSAALFYNDDVLSCGPTSRQSSISWTASYTGTVAVQLNLFNCNQWVSGGSSATLTYRVSTPTTANAGPDQTGAATCGLTTVTLAGNSPQVGTGAWSIITGTGGSFSDPTSPTSTFTGTAGTAYRLRWTISNGSCTASTDDVLVTFNRNPTIANAGSPQTGSSTCGLTTVNIVGNSPSIGSGLWSVVSGAGGAFGSASQASTTFSGTAGSAYTLRWTISNSPCTASFDDVRVTFNIRPDATFSGLNSPYCANSSAATLVPVTNGGTFSGPGVSGSTFNPATAGPGTHSILYTFPAYSASAITFAPVTPSGGVTPTSVFLPDDGMSGSKAIGFNFNFYGTSYSQFDISSNGFITFNLGTGASGCCVGQVIPNSAAPNNLIAACWNDLHPSGGAINYYTMGSSPNRQLVINYTNVRFTNNAGPDITTQIILNETTNVIEIHTTNVSSSPAGSTMGIENATGTEALAVPGRNSTQWNVASDAWRFVPLPCPNATTQTVVVKALPTTANAGPDQSGSATCGLTTATLAGNTPVVGTGAWSIISGIGGTVTTPGSPTSTFTGTAGTSYTLRWTISNAPCASSSDDMVIVFNRNPTVANAGPDQTGASTCGLTTVTLAGNSPVVGSGAWSIVSGTGGSVTTPGSPTSTFTGTAGSTYTLRWTISNSPCTASTDDVVITFNRNPTVSNAGTDQTGASTCGLTSTGLAANAPTVGTGAWSIISGTGGNVIVPGSPTSAFSGTAGTSYTLRWTISNTPCTASTDDVVVTFNQNSTIANAGPDQTGISTCGLTAVTLVGNTPAAGTGTWSIISGAEGSIATPGSPNSSFSGTPGATYTLRWTISNPPCATSTDDVIITFNRNPTVSDASADQTGASTCGLNTVTLAGNLPAVGIGTWSIQAGLGGTVNSPTTPASSFTGNPGSTYTLRWTITNAPCPASSDEVTIAFNQNPTIADAGSDQAGLATCGLNGVNISANAATIGTGLWTIESGSGGSIGDPAAPATTFNGTPGTPYTLRWTIANPPCIASSDEIQITLNAVLDASFTGLNAPYCSTDPSVTLVPATNGGIFSGPGVSGNSFDPAIAGAGIHQVTYTFPPYAVTSVPFSSPALAGDQIFLGDDDISTSLPIGFNFNFYGVDYSQFEVSSNGFMTFNLGTFDPGCCAGQVLPDPTPPNNLIAIAWSDLDPTTGGTINYSLQGTAPNRQLIVNFINVNFIGNQGPDITSSVILHETTNEIEIQTASINNAPGFGGSVTMGIEDVSGTQASVVPGRNSSIWSAVNEGWRFTPVCLNSSTQNVEVKSPPTIADAGPDQTGNSTCGLTEVTLAGNTPTSGTGEWSIVAGTGGSIDDPTSATSTFTGLAGPTYTLRWTISNDPCSASSDDVVITFNQNPTLSAAGADQADANTCGLTSVNLAGNVPAIGTGEWSIISGTGGTVNSPFSAASTFDGAEGSTYSLRWTISNEPCTASSDDITITFNANPSIANAGSDQSSTCGVFALNLDGNAPTFGAGNWTIESGNGGSVSTPSSSTSVFTGSDGSDYTLRWTITNAPCGSTFDEVNISIFSTPVWYKDVDGDLYSDGGTLTQCAQPAGYADPESLTALTGDCDDNDAGVHVPLQYYVDGDHDGFGSTATAMLCASSAPFGYSSNNTDCDDVNAGINAPIQYYIDGDHDGFGSTATAMLCSLTAPFGYADNNTDCDDNDAGVHTGLQYYVDADHDGFGSATIAFLCSSTAPVGYSDNNTDCDDNDISIHATVQYYVDADEDGFGSTQTAMLCSNTAPAGYSEDNTDCDDNDEDVHVPLQYYVDADHDGFGSTTTAMLCASAAPIGYSDNNTDCNDNDGAINSPVQYYVDGDHDGFGSVTTAMLCSTSAQFGFSDNNTDCDDDNAAINVTIQYYVDADHDGYGSTATAMLCSLTAPFGYSEDNTDCDDNNAGVHTGIQYYIDADHDGFGSATVAFLCSSTAPVGYSNNNTDCDDNDINIHATVQYYVDADNDGYGSTATAMLCSNSAPLGYSEDNTDCDDDNEDVHVPLQYYVDADFDGFGSATTAMLCASTAPIGYSDNNTDCNDNDGSINAPIQYYVDGDHDGFGSATTAMLCSTTAPFGYASNNTDCDDGNAAINTPLQYYVDADHDGFGSTATAMLCSLTAPLGYSEDNTDCDDNNASVHIGVQYYVDADHDGFGSTTIAFLCTSTAPLGYSDNNTDCDDNNAGINTPVQYYLDADHDGFGSTAISMQCSLSAPLGYSDNNTDCDDADSDVNSPIQYFVDSDHDGFGSTTTALLCSSSAPFGYADNNTDCDDDNIAINTPVQYYLDGDHDGFGSTATAMLCSTSAPVGYANNNTDCDDDNVAINAAVQYFVDGDHDGYGSTTTAMLCSLTPTLGYSADNTDCNDNDGGIHAPVQYYIDADHDGYGSLTTAMVCSSTAPLGYSLDNTDCNDNDGGVHSPIQYFVDGDHDGFGSTSTAMLCSSVAPLGYANNDTDCNDNDGGVHVPIQYYVDGDGDAYGSSASALFCASVAPIGYSANSTDCNDGNGAINPGVAEICSNGIDDNCNSAVDEGCILPISITGVTSPACGTASNGSVNITVSGGVAGYLYLWSNGAVTEDLAAVPAAIYRVTVTDAVNTTASASFTVSSISSTIPAAPGNISGAVEICVPNSGVYSIASVPNATSYIWTTPANSTLLSGQGTTSISVSFTGSYTTGKITVRAASCGGTSNAKNLTVDKISVPANPGGITGDNSICFGDIITYSIAAIAGASSYTWTAPANSTILSGQGTTAVSIQFFTGYSTGNVSVFASNCSGNGGVKIKAVKFALAAPGNINGPTASVCDGTTKTYSINAVNGATSYNWLVSGATIVSGQGTISINVLFPNGYNSATIQVQAISACGTTPFNTPITVSSKLIVGPISGTFTGYCAGANNIKFTVANVGGASSYAWTVPSGITITAGQGTTQITTKINAGFVSGQITVSAVNACGNGPVASATITGAPDAALAITGSISVCPGATTPYSIAAVPKATTYLWTVPAGWTILSGQGTRNISVRTGSTGGNVTVAAGNTCGYAPISSLSVTIPACKNEEQIGIISESEYLPISMMRIYPNPFSTQFTFEFETMESSPIRVQIFDITGKLIKGMEYRVSQGEHKEQIDLTNESAGIYILSVQQANITKRFRIVKE